MTTNDDSGAHSLGTPHREPTPLHAEPVAAPVVHDQPTVHVHPPAAADRRDLVRWGPVWAGLVVALASFLLLELLFLALGWLSLEQGEPGSTAGLVSGVIGFVAFLLGGLTAGATAMWRSAKDGLLQGVIVWALTTIGIIFLTLFGGGALFGSAADVLTQVANLQRSDLPDVDLSSAVQTARDATTWAVLGLVLSLLAAAIGGAIGGRMWPRRQDVRR